MYSPYFRTVEEYDRKRDLFLSKKKKKKEEKNKKKREQISRQQRARYVDDLEENSDSIETWASRKQNHDMRNVETDGSWKQKSYNH